MLSDLFTFSIQNGLPQDTIYLLLLLPLLATLVIFFRVIVGIGELQLTKGIFLILGIGLLGLRYGIFIFLIALACDLAIQKVLERARLLPPAKHAVSIFFISLIFLGIFITAGYFTKNVFIDQQILLTLLIIVTTQGLLQIHPGDHPLRPLTWLAQILIFIYIGSLLVNSRSIQSFLLQSPFLSIGILFIIILFIARFRGLRVTEYVRFFNVITKNR